MKKVQTIGFLIEDVNIREEKLSNPKVFGKLVICLHTLIWI